MSAFSASVDYRAKYPGLVKDANNATKTVNVVGFYVHTTCSPLLLGTQQYTVIFCDTQGRLFRVIVNKEHVNFWRVVVACHRANYDKDLSPRLCLTNLSILQLDGTRSLSRFADCGYPDVTFYTKKESCLALFPEAPSAGDALLPPAQRPFSVHPFSLKKRNEGGLWGCHEVRVVEVSFERAKATNAVAVIIKGAVMNGPGEFGRVRTVESEPGVIDIAPLRGATFVLWLTNAPANVEHQVRAILYDDACVTFEGFAPGTFHNEPAFLGNSSYCGVNVEANVPLSLKLQWNQLRHVPLEEKSQQPSSLPVPTECVLWEDAFSQAAITPAQPAAASPEATQEMVHRPHVMSKRRRDDDDSPLWQPRP